jgi:hypothetical protein
MGTVSIMECYNIKGLPYWSRTAFTVRPQCINYFQTAVSTLRPLVRSKYLTPGAGCGWEYYWKLCRITACGFLRAYALLLPMRRGRLSQCGSVPDGNIDIGRRDGQK